MNLSPSNANPTRRVFFVRHGQSTANAAQVIAGATDALLTEKGREQAATLRGHLAGRSFDAVWSSDLSRAVETARIAGFEPKLDPRVRELDFGTLEGRPWGTVMDEHKDDLSEFATFQAPGGESVPAMIARIEAFASGLKPGTHLVFCHGGVIRIALGRFGVHRFVNNCEIIGVDWDLGRVLDGPELGLAKGGAR